MMSVYQQDGDGRLFREFRPAEDPELTVRVHCGQREQPSYDYDE